MRNVPAALPPLRLVLSCLTVWLVAAGGAQSEVWATCGDYLWHGSHEERYEPAPEVPAPSASPARDHTFPRCNGPQCREAPELPAIPDAPPPVSPSSDRWLSELNTGEGPRGTQQAGFLVVDRDGRPPQGQPRKIDHIPR